MKRYCTQMNKRMYATRQLADENRRYQESQQPAISLRIFMCWFCNHWHLTHTKRITRRVG